jgi:hypothetical protein
MAPGIANKPEGPACYNTRADDSRQRVHPEPAKGTCKQKTDDNQHRGGGICQNMNKQHAYCDCAPLINRAGDNGTGFRAQLLFFLDDLIPLVFGTPLITDRPARNQITW